jgi:nucleoside phosphorylase
MLLIIAAMAEELNIAMDLCPDREKIHIGGVGVWQAVYNSRKLCFFKTRVGPKRSAKNLTRLLDCMSVSRILLIGYAGGLDPDLKVGDLVAVRRALNLGELRKGDSAFESARIDSIYELADEKELTGLRESPGLNICIGDTLTSRHVWGDPVHKDLLFKKFRASIVDMETGALAAAAQSKGIPFRCIRAVSDEAGDSFLKFISYDPLHSWKSRLFKRAGNENWLDSYREWKKRAAIARSSLQRFLAGYLSAGGK